MLNTRWVRPARTATIRAVSIQERRRPEGCGWNSSRSAGRVIAMPSRVRQHGRAPGSRQAHVAQEALAHFPHDQVAQGVRHGGGQNRQELQLEEAHGGAEEPARAQDLQREPAAQQPFAVVDRHAARRRRKARGEMPAYRIGADQGQDQGRPQQRPAAEHHHHGGDEGVAEPEQRNVVRRGERQAEPQRGQIPRDEDPRRPGLFRQDGRPLQSNESQHFASRADSVGDLAIQPLRGLYGTRHYGIACSGFHGFTRPADLRPDRSVTPLQQNCTLVWCNATKRAAIIDPAAR